MKAVAIVTAALLAAGGAWAQTSNESLGQKADRVFDRAENATSRAVNPPPGGETIGQKADRVFDRMEDGTKRIWNKATGKHEPAPAAGAQVRNDTRAMGAAPAAPRQDLDSDHDRRSRMDGAYRNWQSQQR